MSDTGIFAEFIGRKVNKVRWRPDDLMASTMFVTGSWDNEYVRLTDCHVIRERFIFIFTVTGQRNRTVGTDIE